MHAKAGRGIHLANSAADAAITLGDILGEKIHAAHVKADRTHRAFGHFAIVGMNDVGHIGGGAARG